VNGLDDASAHLLVGIGAAAGGVGDRDGRLAAAVPAEVMTMRSPATTLIPVACPVGKAAAFRRVAPALDLNAVMTESNVVLLEEVTDWG
jgi:hypothetical protein